MKQIVRIAINNVLHSKLKSVIIVALMGFAMLISVISIGVAKNLPNALEAKTDELNSTAKISVMPYNQGKISNATLELIKGIEGVKSVFPQYLLSGLLSEEKDDKPIYNITLNGFDFNEALFLGADDFRGQNVSGILLPDISYEFFDGEITLSDYVGREVYFTYSFMSGESYQSKVIKCKVIGVYKAFGEFETNPVYMSMDLFSDILTDFSYDISGVPKADVYLYSAEATDYVAENIMKLGLDVYYESTLDDYISSLKDFVTSSLVLVGILLALTAIVIIQTILANLSKRSDTIGVLKAYGYSNFLICFMIWLEIFIYSICSIIISAIFLLGFEDNINEFFGRFMRGMSFDLNTYTPLILISIALIISLISSIVPVRRLKRMNVIDVLKSS